MTGPLYVKVLLLVWLQNLASRLMRVHLEQSSSSQVYANGYRFRIFCFCPMVLLTSWSPRVEFLLKAIRGLLGNRPLRVWLFSMIVQYVWIIFCIPCNLGWNVSTSTGLGLDVEGFSLGFRRSSLLASTLLSKRFQGSPLGNLFFCSIPVLFGLLSGSQCPE